MFGRPIVSVSLLALSLLAVGCGAPEGARGSRVEPGATTGAERHTDQPLPTGLAEFSDQTSQALAQELALVPTIRNAPGRVTVIVGDINNKTGNVSSNDFEYVRSRTRNNLLRSAYVTDKVKFVENRARMSALRNRELVGPDSNNGEPANYDASTTFALNGDFYRIQRNRNNLYYMEFQLVNFATNEIVWSSPRYEERKANQKDTWFEDK